MRAARRMGAMSTLSSTPRRTLPSPPDGFGLPAWAWPVLGLVAGSLLVVVIHGTCFVDPNC